MASQHPDFWFHDGSIVLCADKMLFRVHQTVLAKHSEVFEDLFSLSPPAAEEDDIVDGCRVVLLHDSKEDFIDLLNAIYNPSYFDDLPSDAGVGQVLTYISGVLRLSTKYLIRSLRQRCITLLISKFPTTFDDYVAKSNRDPPEKYDSDSVMRAAVLAQENNVPEILPYAYYCIARMKPRRMLSQRHCDISWRDKVVCLVGRERLREAEMTLSYLFLLVFQRAPTCETYLCADARLPHAEWHVIEAAKSPSPLREYTTWSRLNLCQACVAHCQREHAKGRREVWERLPGIFGLASWEQLRKQQGFLDGDPK
ncbi:hypothetical protein AGABI2DRAFT_60514 [Agaricus bisporus var. bisporus H97]|uniref:hypothetical protein n=1 Tax=Agaricus bisporus var. bisporus (strain H97 / ATCC MYA-4626 / FGSC 10389) TaxID=936046 RepID=UPI00029F540C|nr:hypothetical protein AGABI2DRAFT_60514 [Agaricus bisporus var. bisporus H97]EKV50791.1 hypothetical protein AGABI2DRAFT_60514 [Agaricus bisporus var. bisporus H97]